MLLYVSQAIFVVFESVPLLKRDAVISNPGLRKCIARTGFVLLPQLIQSPKNVLHPSLLINHISPSKGSRSHKVVKGLGGPGSVFVSFRSCKLYLRAFVP